MTIHKHIDFEVPSWGELENPPQAWPSFRDLITAMSPVAYWRLGETSGSSAFDELGNFDGSYQGNPELGRPGALTHDTNASVEFDGVDDRVVVPSSVVTGNSPRTISVWASTMSPDGSIRANCLVDIGDEFPSGQESNANEEFGLSIEGTVLTLRTSNGNRIWSPPGGKSLNDGSWHHYALIFVGGNEDDLTAYMDGELMPISSTNTGGSKPLDTAQHETAIGSTVDRTSLGIGGYFDGFIDEVAIWDHALSETAIMQIHHRGRAYFQLGASS